MSEALKPIILLAIQKDSTSDHVRGQIAEIAPQYEVVIGLSREEIDSVIDRVEIAAGGVPTDLLIRASNLRWYLQSGAGVEWMRDRGELLERGVTVTTGSEIRSHPVAEHVMAFLLTFARSFHRAHRAQRNREWLKPEYHEVFEMTGKTVLLLGLGGIGLRVAALASAFSMKVFGIRKNSDRAHPAVDRIFPLNELATALPEADFVVLTLPVTDETRGIFGENEFRAMARDAYFVNVGRGALVDERAMIRALQNGWIAGAGLDVMEEEPLPRDSPLWTMENVVLTAHYGGRTPEVERSLIRVFLRYLQHYVRREPIPHSVEPGRGY